MKFDKLHILDDDYFEPMAISADDKAKRRELAEYLTDAFLYFFSVYEVHGIHQSMLSKALYEQLLADKISEAVTKVTGIDGYISDHIRTLAKEVVNTTFKNVPEDDNQNQQVRQTDHPKTKNPLIESLTALHDSDESSDSPLITQSDDSHIVPEDEMPLVSKEDDEVEEMMEQEATSEYWLSIRRAINIANNETNTILNYNDFVDAKNRGLTHKTWLTMLDNKVRDTHEEVEGTTIGIDEHFVVGDSEMRFPHDMELAPNPNEVINCRCAVEYK